MSGNVVTIDADASGHDAVSLTVRNKIRHLPVVDGAGLLCGIVTESDLLRRIIGADAGAKGGVDIRCAITVSRRV